MTQQTCIINTRVSWAEPLAAGPREVRHSINGVEYVGRAEVYAGDILVLRGCLPWITEIVEAAEALDAWREPSVITEDKIRYDPAFRDSPLISVSGNPALTEFAARLGLLEGMFVRAYQSFVNPHLVVTRGSGFEMLRYREGQHFKEHIDEVTGNPLLSTRRLSFVAFAGSPDLLGGVLYFPRQNVLCTPLTGDVVLFPSTFTHPHEALPVTRGTKHSLVTWFMH